MVDAKAMSKYHNRPVDLDGYHFDSTREAARYGELKLMVLAGGITDLRVHPLYTLQDGFYFQGKRIPPIRYEGDFEYYECATGKTVVEDVKGVETAAFKIKYKMMLRCYPQFEVRIIK